MAKLIIIISFLFFGSASIFLAQKSTEGVYLTAKDFKSDNISYTKGQHKKHKLHLHEVFNTSTINIVNDGSIITLCKDSVFGYRDAENNYFRFYHYTAYQIITMSDSLLLYRRTSLGGYKRAQAITTYFFSITANSALYPLSKWNLKHAFFSDSKFHELLDLYFKNDNELTNYDNYNKCYQLNRIYNIRQQL